MVRGSDSLQNEETMKLAILKEITPGETRVAAIPQTAAALTKLGLEVLIETGAGDKSFFSDADYQAAGAKVTSDIAELFAADIVAKVTAPIMDKSAGRNELELLGKGKILIAVLGPAANQELIAKLAAGGVTSFALDQMPRITRAQSMDVLSSMSTIAGYKAVLLAADTMVRMCPMMMTAAGTVKPADALIIGAGVAGLQAIATAKRIGAVVMAVDVRPAVKEQVESIGARFIPMEVDHSAEDAGGYATDLGEQFYKSEQEIIAPYAKRADMIITTALIPNRRAPILITKQMVESMKGGSVIVDLAAGSGGNCSLTEADQKVVHNGVAILGPTNLPASVPYHASQMFSRNVATFIKELITEDGELKIDMENEVITGTMVTHEGKVLAAPPKQAGQESEE